MNLDHHLPKQLKPLRLGGFLESLDLRLQQAQSSSLGYIEFLQLVVQEEIERREAMETSALTLSCFFRKRKEV